MSKILYVDVRSGHVIKEADKLLQVIDRDLRTPGNLPSKLTLTVKNIKTGYVNEVRVHPEDKVEIAYLENRTMSYLYRDGAEFVFMDTETYDQTNLSLAVLEDALNYIKENDEVSVTFYEGNPISVLPPANVTLKVKETSPAVKNSTASAQYKDAVLETGVGVKVPSFIAQGESIVVDTTTGAYVSRAKG